VRAHGGEYSERCSEISFASCWRARRLNSDVCQWGASQDNNNRREFVVLLREGTALQVACVHLARALSLASPSLSWLLALGVCTNQVCAGVAAQGHSRRRDVDAEQAPLAVSTLDFFSVSSRSVALDVPTVHTRQPVPSTWPRPAAHSSKASQTHNRAGCLLRRNRGDLNF
jgi:hypothetical protein